MQKLIFVIDLHRSSDHFESEWMSKLKVNPSAENWRLKVSNWRKILDKMVGYYENVLGISFDIRALPDVNKLGKECSKTQLSILLQLVLGVAVNCDNKHQYIQNITSLDVNVQQKLMEAIQQLMSGETRMRSESNESQLQRSMLFDSLNFEQAQKDLKEELQNALEQLRLAEKRHQTLQEKNFELEQLLNEEHMKRLQLNHDNEQLNERLGQLESKHSKDRSEHVLQDQRVQKLQLRLEQLEKELLRTEAQREECSMRSELLENDLKSAQSNNEQLLRKVKKAELLKDELDVHRHTADKMSKYEHQLETYKQKLEELLDQRKQHKLMEEKNNELMQTNLRLESELKKANAMKLQIADYKKQMQELHQQVIEKTHQCDKAEFDMNKLNEQFSILLHEKKSLAKEKLELKMRLNDKNPPDLNFSLVEELDCLSGGSLRPAANNNLGFEITTEHSNQYKEQIFRLEHENKLLKEKLEETDSEEFVLLRTNLEDSKSRVNELEQDNRVLNKKIFEMESRLENISNFNMKQDKHSSQSETDRIVLTNKMQELEKTIVQLNVQLNRKQEEIHEVESKYRTYVGKAKEAMTVLEPLSLNIQSGPPSVMLNSVGLGNNFSLPIPNNLATVSGDLFEQVRTALMRKEAELCALREEFEKKKSFMEFEQRLITTTVHKLAFDLQRRAATQRVQNASVDHLSTGLLSKVPSNSSLSSTGSSLLNKHRQSTTRKFAMDRLTNM